MRWNYLALQTHSKHHYCVKTSLGYPPLTYRHPPDTFQIQNHLLLSVLTSKMVKQLKLGLDLLKTYLRTPRGTPDTRIVFRQPLDNSMVDFRHSSDTIGGGGGYDTIQTHFTYFSDTFQLFFRHFLDTCRHFSATFPTLSRHFLDNFKTI